MALSLDLSPILAAGVKIESLPLSPQEGFVLSRINGMTSVREIISGTGLPPQMVEAALQKLEGLGAIEFQNVQAAAPRSRSASRPKPPTAAPAVGSPDGTGKVLERIELIAKSMQKLDHYQLLSLRRGATANDIKEAYVKLSREMHPDRFHKVNLGKRKAVVESVFARISEAYEVLKDDSKRREYDRHLLPESARRNGTDPQAGEGVDAYAKFMKMADADMQKGNYTSALQNYKIAGGKPSTDKELAAKIQMAQLCRTLDAGVRRYEEKGNDGNLLADPKIKDAMERLEGLPDEFPRHEKLLRGCTEMVLTLSKDIKLMRRVAELLYKAAPKPQHMVYLGKIFEREHKYEDALRNYERALKQDSNCTDAIQALQQLKQRKR